ncbi:MAG: hypothetical protein LJE62_12550 [Silicimonas sp.]|nr:hypothetical protein [Silicimonas sp.]
MDLKKRKKALHGLVGAIGVVIAVAGFVGGMFTVPTTIVLTFAVWAIGATLVNLIAS